MYILEYPWLLLLLPLPWLLRRWLPARHSRQDAVRLPFFASLAAATGQRPTAGTAANPPGRLSRGLDWLAWGLLTLALAAPARLEPPIERMEPLRDLMLAVDASLSMEATDAGDGLTRMQAAQEVLDGFIDSRNSDRLGLLIFGDRHYTQVGFTLDHRTLRALLSEVQPGIAGARTALGDAIGLGVRLFANSPAQDKVMILLSDGSDTASHMAPDEAAGIAQQHGIRIHCIGFGAADSAGEFRPDEAMLQRIAKDTGGRYLHANNRAELAEAFAALDQLTPVLQKQLLHQPRHPLYVYPLGAAIGLLLLQLFSTWRSCRTIEVGDA